MILEYLIQVNINFSASTMMMVFIHFSNQRHTINAKAVSTIRVSIIKYHMRLKNIKIKKRTGQFEFQSIRHRATCKSEDSLML